MRKIWYLCVMMLLIVISVRTAVGKTRQEEGFLNWSDWYPVNRGQAEGERVLNWWRRDREDPLNPYYQGQSAWNYPGTPTHFPVLYEGREVDYFINWQCNKADIDPNCEDWHTYQEILSEGTALGDNSYLEAWARGGRGSLDQARSIFYEVYYEPEAFNNCDLVTVQASTDEALQDPAVKAPYIFRLRDEEDIEYISPPVCVILFDGYDLLAGQVTRAQRWFVVNTVLDIFVTPENVNAVQAENQYYTDDPNYAAAFDTWCQTQQNERYCVQNGANWEGRSRIQDGVTGKIWAFELYWMREVPSDNRLRNGFGAFQWWTAYPNGVEWDDDLTWWQQTCTSVGERDIDCEWAAYAYIPLAVQPE